MPFPEAVERLLNKKICMNCSARNPPKATQCRRCGYQGLRVKSRERVRQDSVGFAHGGGTTDVGFDRNGVGAPVRSSRWTASRFRSR